jgi:hypothetical protein
MALPDWMGHFRSPEKPKNRGFHVYFTFFQHFYHALSFKVHPNKTLEILKRFENNKLPPGS